MDLVIEDNHYVALVLVRRSEDKTDLVIERFRKQDATPLLAENPVNTTS